MSSELVRQLVDPSDFEIAYAVTVSGEMLKRLNNQVEFVGG
jgi:hypothetical protein